MTVVYILKEQTKIEVDRFIHLPDKQFVDWCSKQFHINRGVFNVIDGWFFENGIPMIMSRRQIIIQFLTSLQLKDIYHEEKQYLQFGKGGVVKSLQNFVKEDLTKNSIQQLGG